MTFRVPRGFTGRHVIYSRNVWPVSFWLASQSCGPGFWIFSCRGLSFLITANFSRDEMCFLAVTAGSWVGTRLRSHVPQVDFQRLFKLLVTLLALRMIALPFL